MTELDKVIIKRWKEVAYKAIVKIMWLPSAMLLGLMERLWK